MKTATELETLLLIKEAKIQQQNIKISKLKEIIGEVRDYLEYQLEQLDLKTEVKAKMLCIMCLSLLDEEKEI